MHGKGKRVLQENTVVPLKGLEGHMRLCKVK